MRLHYITRLFPTLSPFFFLHCFKFIYTSIQKQIFTKPNLPGRKRRSEEEKKLYSNNISPFYRSLNPHYYAHIEIMSVAWFLNDISLCSDESQVYSEQPQGDRSLTFKLKIKILLVEVMYSDISILSTTAVTFAIWMEC